MGGLRAQIREWVREELHAKTRPMTRAGTAKQNAPQMGEAASKAERAMARRRYNLDKAIDRHDFANADRLIFPVFSE